MAPLQRIKIPAKIYTRKTRHKNIKKDIFYNKNKLHVPIFIFKIFILMCYRLRNGSF